MPTPTSPPNPRRSPLSLHTGMSTSSGDEQSLRHLQQETQATTCTNRDIVHLVRALQLRGLHSFLLCHDPAPVVEQQQASSTLTKNCTCGISPVFCSLHCGQTSQRSNWNVQHFDNELDLWHLHVHVWLGLLELVADDRRDVHNRKEPARPTRPPSSHPPPRIRPGGEDIPPTGTSIDSPARAPSRRAG